MSDDHSLDEFIEDESGSRDEEGDPPVDGTASVDGTPSPAVTTFAWMPDGGVCDACGATVHRRWRDGEDLVCPECKEW